MSTDSIDHFKHELLSGLKDVQEPSLKAALSDDSAIKVEQVTNAIWEKVLSVGVQQLHPFLTLDVCKLACADLGLALEADSDAKTVLLEGIKWEGLSGFLDKASLKLLRAIHRGLNLSRQVGADKAAVQKEILDEVLLSAVQAFLQTIPKPVLTQWAQDLKLTDDVSSYDKDKMVDALMVKIFHLAPLDYVNARTSVKQEKKHADSESSQSEPEDDDVDSALSDDEDDDDDDNDDEDGRGKRSKKGNYSDSNDDDDKPKTKKQGQNTSALL